eukprot:6189044-Pleurochrysis_carterae.AAC.1
MSVLAAPGAGTRGGMHSSNMSMKLHSARVCDSGMRSSSSRRRTDPGRERRSFAVSASIVRSMRATRVARAHTARWSPRCIASHSNESRTISCALTHGSCIASMSVGMCTHASCQWLSEFSGKQSTFRPWPRMSLLTRKALMRRRAYSSSQRGMAPCVFFWGAAV